MLAARTVDSVPRSTTDRDITHVTCVNGRYRVLQRPAMRPSALSSRRVAAQLPARPKRGQETSTRGGARGRRTLTGGGIRCRVGDLDRRRQSRGRALFGGPPLFHVAQGSVAASGRRRLGPFFGHGVQELGRTRPDVSGAGCRRAGQRFGGRSVVL